MQSSVQKLWVSVVCVCCLCAVGAPARISQPSAAATTQINTVKQMILRYTPQYAPNFILQIESSDEQFFMLFTNVDSQVNINIRGNDGVSLAKGYAYYLETYLHVSLSFTGDNLHDLPTVPPEVPTFITQRRWSRYSYYQNVCTASYSMAWWDWER